jgi:hypothetical protein
MILQSVQEKGGESEDQDDDDDALVSVADVPPVASYGSPVKCQ